MRDEYEPCEVCGCTGRVPNEVNEICDNCFAELNSHIDSKVEFDKNNRTMVGRFLATKTGVVQLTGAPGSEDQSTRVIPGRPVTLKHGAEKLSRLVEQLDMNSNCVQKAVKLYNAALNQGISQGIKSDMTMCALLYIVSRYDGTGHTLLDFAPFCNENKPFLVVHLANSICRKLGLHLPNVDPCLYISRFASKMELSEEMTKNITIRATRIVQHMKNYDINVGRKPSGLCGAALLVAATELGIKLDRKKMIDVLRIQTDTVRRRLIELRKSTNPSLSLSEYLESGLFKGRIPPLAPGEMLERTHDARFAEKIFHELEALGGKKTSEESDKISSSELKLFVEANVPDEVDASEVDLINENMMENYSENMTENGTENMTENDTENMTENDASPDDENIDSNASEYPKNLGTSLELLGVESWPPAAPLKDEFAIPLTVDYMTVELTEIDVDDEFCTENEFNDKLIWYNENFGDFLKERLEKRLAKEKDMLVRKENYLKKTQMRTLATVSPLPVNATPAQAFSHVCQSRKMSSKVDYDVLKKIEDDIKRGGMITERAADQRSSYESYARSNESDTRSNYQSDAGSNNNYESDARSSYDSDASASYKSDED